MECLLHFTHLLPSVACRLQAPPGRCYLKLLETLQFTGKFWIKPWEISDLGARKGSARAPLHTKASHIRVGTSTMSGTNRVVEHAVFFKVKEGVPPEQAEAMVTALRSLKSLDCVLQLTAGPALQVRSGSYTHALHSRHKDKDALANYSSHPNHLDVVHKFVLPITDDILALDWEADIGDAVLVTDVGAVRVVALKPKEDVPNEEQSGVREILKDYPNLFPVIKQASVGENFSPVRAKGFQWGFVALFPSVKELEELTQNEKHVNLQYSKVSPILQDFIVVDYNTTSPSHT